MAASLIFTPKPSLKFAMAPYHILIVIISSVIPEQSSPKSAHICPTKHKNYCSHPRSYSISETSDMSDFLEKLALSRFKESVSVSINESLKYVTNQCVTWRWSLKSLSHAIV